MIIADLTRWEALDILGQVGILAEQGRWGSMAIVLGMTEEIAEGLTMDEVVEALTVRMALVSQRAGLTVTPPE